MVDPNVKGDGKHTILFRHEKNHGHGSPFQTDGNQSAAARLLGISQPAMSKRMRKEKTKGFGLET